MSQRRVLVVEDSAMCAEAVEAALLGINGLVVRVAGTAEAALRELDSDAYSALITDVNLPGMDGLELVAHIRGQARLAGMPVIFISAESGSGVQEKAFGLGADAFFVKPYSPAAVRRRLEELLNDA